MKFTFSILSAILGGAVCIATAIALLSGDSDNISLTFFNFIIGLLLVVNSGMVVDGEWKK